MRTLCAAPGAREEGLFPVDPPSRPTPGGGVFITTEQSWGLQGNKSADSLRKASPPVPGSPDGRECGKSFRGVQGELALEAPKLALGVLSEKSRVKMPRMGKRASWVSSPLSREGRGVGACERVRWSPAHAPARTSGLANPPAVSWQLGLPCPQDSQVQPGSVPSAQMGQRLPGNRACPRHRDPPPGRRWSDRRPSPERPGNWPLPPPRRTYSPSPPPW